MHIKQVSTAADIKQFLNIAVALNNGNAAYIQPLHQDIEKVFDAKKNKAFKYGTINRWILVDDANKTIGRIAAFYHKKYINKGTNYVTGGCGFFECINNQSAANLLFNVAEQWLKTQGCEAMDGPINFGDRDAWWGLMVEGFNKPPVVGMPFNLPYYQQLFEGYGFKNFYNQYWYSMKVDEPLPEKFTERHAKFKAKPDYSARHIKLNQLEKYAQDFATVYNAAWAQHGENKEITQQQVLKIFNTIKPIMDERVVWFAYYKDEPIAMFINLPDLNQYIKNFKGKLGLWQKIQLLYNKQFTKRKKLVGLAFGIVPKFQSLGIDSYIIKECANLIQNKNWFGEYEMGWAGEWNPKMVNIYKSLGGQQSRRMVTFRYIFDNKYPFERHPIMQYNN